MGKQQVSRSIFDWLTDQLQCWRDEGIISPEQSQRIAERYAPAESDGWSLRGRFDAVSLLQLTLLGLAGLLASMAALLVVGYNWDQLPGTAKLVIVLGAVIGTHAAAFYARYRRASRILGEVLTLVACLFYGVAIWQIAQIYHIQSDFPAGMLLWAVGVLPLTLLGSTPLLHLLYVVLLAIWTIMDTIGGSGPLHLTLGNWHSVPTSVYLMIPLCLPGLVWAYRRGALITTFLYIAVITIWALLQPISWRLEWHTIHFLGLVGAVLLGVAQLHDSRSPMAIPYRLFGGGLVALSLALLSFFDLHKDVIEHVGDQLERHGAYAISAILIIPGALVGLLLLGATKLAPTRKESLSDLAGRLWLTLALVALFVGLALGNVVMYGAGDADMQWAATATLVANLAMIGLAVWLIRLGVVTGRLTLFASGVAYFLLWAILRYADLFGVLGGMLGAAAVFFTCAVALVAMAVYWRKFRPREQSSDQGHVADDGAASWPMLDQLARWSVARLRWIAVAAIVLQLGLLSSIIVEGVMPLAFGQDVVLEIVPVDPRDMFRGDYVILNYEFSQVAPGELVGWEGGDDWHELAGRSVFVTLAPPENGRQWRVERVGLARPETGATYIEGTIQRRGRVQCGIESFYVQEGTGHDYEAAARRGNLSAEVAVGPFGNATLRRLVIEE